MRVQKGIRNCFIEEKEASRKSSVSIREKKIWTKNSTKVPKEVYRGIQTPQRAQADPHHRKRKETAEHIYRKTGKLHCEKPSGALTQ